MKAQAGTAPLPGMIAFQEDSVVSRELLRSDGGTVTLFAFDKGQGLSNHKAPFEVGLVVVEGEAELTIENEKRVIKKNDYTKISANQLHSLIASTPFKMLLIMMKS